MRFVSVIVLVACWSSVGCAAVSDDQESEHVASVSAAAAKQQSKPSPAKSSCPADRPKDGGQCNVAEQCSYDVAGCGVIVATCDHHQWATTNCTVVADAGAPDDSATSGDTAVESPDAVATDSGSGSGSECPADMPVDGSPCGSVSSSCMYFTSACVVVTACTNNVWSVPSCSGT